MSRPFAAQLLILVVAAFMAAATFAHPGGPYCSVRLFDGDGGLNQRSVKQVAVDRDGVVWLATWNGLVRYDGYEFDIIRPSLTDSVRRYSSRFRDIRAAADGRLWCRIDDRLVRFSPSDNRFEDIHSAIERRLGRKVAMHSWRQTAGLDTVVIKEEGGFLIVPDAAPLTGIAASASEPRLKYHTKANRRLGDFGPYGYAGQAYGRLDGEGRVWIVTRGGDVVYAPSRESDPQIIASLGVDDGSVQFCVADSSGGLWFRSSAGAHRVEPKALPFGRLAGGNNGRVLASVLDRDGRLWVAETDRLAIAVYDSVSDPRPRYLTPRGGLSDRFEAWDHAVYSLAAGRDGVIWVGTKPDGLFRLTPLDSRGGYEIRHICGGNIYDILPLADGSLALATLGGGLRMLDDACGPSPRERVPEGYPLEAKGCRRLSLLSSAHGPDTLLVATTGGLLAYIPATGETNLMVTEVGRASSLGCIAVTDIARLPDGRLFVSTESDGINSLAGSVMGRASFGSYNDAGSNRLDVAATVVPAPDGRLLAIGSDHIYTLDPDEPDGAPRIYGEAFWRKPLRFTDMRPLSLGGNLWLLGTDDGAITTSLSPDDTGGKIGRVFFTSVSVGNRPDSLLATASHRIVLGRDERSLTLRYAAPDYSSPGDIRYRVRLNSGGWGPLTDSRSLTLFDLSPGTYTVEVEATDHLGSPSAGSIGRMTVEVIPKFHETVLARILLVILLTAIIAGAVWLWLYVRAIRRKQRETLEAYLKLMETTAGHTSEPVVDNEPQPSAPQVNETDAAFMDSVMAYVRERLSDPEADVDDMARATGVSRSGLTRKMRSLMGVSPADFLRQTRMAHAATLLLTTDRPVKEIAFECGYADINYFGKCFKAHHGLTPTAYRKSPAEGERG